MDGSLAVLERAEIRYRTYSPVFNGPYSFPDGFRHVLATVSAVIPLLACLLETVRVFYTVRVWYIPYAYTRTV